ncbi:unnamed protein product [Rotaria magnacalcarata]
MSDPLLSTDKDDVNNHNEATNPTHSSIERNDEEEKQKQAQQQINCLSELTLAESDSFFTVLKRLCFYWRRIALEKIRVILTLLFMSMLNLTTRITCFTRQRTPSSSSSFNTSVSSSSIRTLEEEELNNSSKSLLFIEKTHQQQQQQIDLPSLENSTMAQILMQQKIHRSSNISINRPATSQKDTSLVMRHSVDDRLFYHDSKQLLHFLTRVASEPQIFKHHHSQLANSNVKLIKSTRDFTISLPISNASVQLNELKNNEILFDDILIFNCDKIQSVSNSTTEDFTSDEIDNIVSTMNQPSEERLTLTDELEPLHVNGDSEAAYTNGYLKISESSEDVLIDSSSSLNDSDPHGERHFRRRKRRSSLTKTSLSLDDTQSIADLIEKISIDNETPQEANQNLELIESDDKENKNIIAQDTSDNKEPTQTIDDAEKSAPLRRCRGRRLRQRLYHHAVEVSSPQEITPNISSESYLSHETLHVESTTKISTPQPPTSPTLTVPSNQVTPNIAGGRLKRVGSNPSPKKNVRFADSVGRELVEVQYINSSTNGESRELAFLLDLSSSPPSFTNNNLYLPITSCSEHKPWSFDVVSKPTKPINAKPHSKRFYCLFRQPDSEHSDIYLHEVWKSQIKLEHADIPYISSSTGEQRLYGTLWVTNIGYQKAVSIKYTFNNWLNVYESEAQYCRHSNDSCNIDQFQITVPIPKDVDRIDFVLRYCVNGQEYWDNNLGKNYALQTDSAYTTATTISLPHDQMSIQNKHNQFIFLLKSSISSAA